jgi:hypothetical protein
LTEKIMKTRTNLAAGFSYAECTQQTNWWRLQAGLMKQFYENPTAELPESLWIPGHPVPRAGGWAGGVFVPDRSEVCNTI